MSKGHTHTEYWVPMKPNILMILKYIKFKNELEYFMHISKIKII